MGQSKLIKKKNYRNRYQKPNLKELVVNVALAISGNTEELIWFSDIDLKYAYSQMKLSEATSQQGNFGIVEGTITGTYRFKMGGKPNEFQRILDYLQGHLLGVHVYLDDILIAARGSAERHWSEVRRTVEVFDSNNAEIKWSKCTFFVKEIELIGFRLSTKGTLPFERKVESTVKKSNRKKIRIK